MILILVFPATCWWVLFATATNELNWSTPFVLAGGLGLLGVGLSMLGTRLRHRGMRTLTKFLLAIGIATAFSGALFSVSLYLYTGDTDFWLGFIFYIAPMLMAIAAGITSWFVIYKAESSEKSAPNNQFNKGLGLRRAH